MILYSLHINILIFWIYWVRYNMLLKFISLVSFSFSDGATRNFKLHMWMTLHLFWTKFFLEKTC